MMQSALERPKVIEPTLGTRVECEPFCAIMSLRVSRQARKSIVGRAPPAIRRTSCKTQKPMLSTRQASIKYWYHFK